jgi:hypothetical protein
VGAPGGGHIKADPLKWLGDYLTSQVSVGYVAPLSTPAQLAEFHDALRGNPLAYMKARGFTRSTLRRVGVGWDADRQAFVIPIRDAAGELVNEVRRPWPHTTGPKYKLPAGRGIPERVQLYPLPLRSGAVLAVGGLLDALLARQHGLNAVSGTHGIGTALDVWLPHVRGRQVAVMWDVGEENAMHQRVAALNAAGAYAWPVRFSELEGFEGKDLTDALTGGYTAQDLKNLINHECRRSS